MLDVYYGEFLINPIPLELSLNYCSHKCAYCFANLNQPGRRLDAPKLMRFLAGYKNRQTLAAQLLQQGYPVVVSNRVDPFAASNFLQTLPILEVMTALDIPLQFQTKGGRGITEALAFLKPAVWYISVSTMNEELRRQIEPGAPAIESRFERMEQLTGLGHRVVLGLNPCVPEWLPDPAPLLERAKICGVWGAWIERLHLNKDQAARLKPKEVEALTPAVIERAKKRRTAAPDEEIFHRARAIAQDIGLEVYSVGQPISSKFFAPYRDVYAQTFPVMQDFINLCYEAGYTLDDLITFEQFAAFMGQSLPMGKYSIAHYLGATARTLWRKYNIPAQMTYRQLLGIIWDQPSTKYGLARLPNFAYAALWEENPPGPGWVQLVDEAEMPYLVFSPYFKKFYYDVRLT